MSIRSQKELIYSPSWDILIILDACRYDTFKRLFDNEFSIQPAWSEGSCTIEWFAKTFTKPLKDVVYISGSPMIYDREFSVGGYTIYPPEIFFRVIPAWKKAWRKVGACYTSDPQIIYFITIAKSIAHKDKRFIVHFVQPHAPYVSRPELAKYFDPHMFRADKMLWGALQRGEVPVVLAKKGYEENLIFIMKYVRNLIKRFRNKRIVITSDHGEAFGEAGIFNHPCGSKEKVLRVVPWCVV